MTIVFPFRWCSIDPPWGLCRKWGMFSRLLQSYHIIAFNIEKNFHFFSDLVNFNSVSANPTKWSNTLKQFVGNLPTNCLSVFDHFVKLAPKGLRSAAVSLRAYFIWLRQKTKERVGLWKGLVLNNWVVVETALRLPLPSPPPLKWIWPRWKSSLISLDFSVKKVFLHEILEQWPCG